MTSRLNCRIWCRYQTPLNPCIYLHYLRKEYEAFGNLSSSCIMSVSACKLPHGCRCSCCYWIKIIVLNQILVVDFSYVEHIATPTITPRFTDRFKFHRSRLSSAECGSIEEKKAKVLGNSDPALVSQSSILRNMVNRVICLCQYCLSVPCHGLTNSVFVWL